MTMGIVRIVDQGIDPFIVEGEKFVQMLFRLLCLSLVLPSFTQGKTLITAISYL